MREAFGYFITTILVCWMVTSLVQLIHSEIQWRRFQRWLADPNSEAAQFEKAIEGLREKRRHLNA